MPEALSESPGVAEFRACRPHVGEVLKSSPAQRNRTLSEMIANENDKSMVPSCRPEGKKCAVSPRPRSADQSDRKTGGFPLPSHRDMEALHAVFPTVEVEVIEAVLQSSGSMEAAADALAAMAADGAVGPPSAPPNFGGERFPGGGGLSPPFNASAQVEQDEALALALQQQLVWEDEEEELARARHARLEQAAAYPGLGGPQFVGQRGARDRHSRPPADLDDSPGPLEGLGSAVYSAGAATLGAAGAAASSLWEWVTRCHAPPAAKVRALSPHPPRDAP